MKKLIFFVFVIIVALPALSFAQANISVSQAIENTKAVFSDIKNRSNELELMKRNAERESVSNRNSEKKFPQIKEDFERIQIINADSLQANAVKNNPDYKTIYKAASEIRNRAERLKSNLFSSENEKQSVDKDKLKTEQNDLLKQNLTTLCIELDNAIGSFVLNNMFQNIHVINPKDLEKAESDLENVIKFSFAIEQKQTK